MHRENAHIPHTFFVNVVLFGMCGKVVFCGQDGRTRWIYCHERGSGDGAFQGLVTVIPHHTQSTPHKNQGRYYVTCTHGMGEKTCMSLLLSTFQCP